MTVVAELGKAEVKGRVESPGKVASEVKGRRGCGQVSPIHARPILTLKRDEARGEREGGCLVKPRMGQLLKSSFHLWVWKNGRTLELQEREKESLQGKSVSSSLGEGRTPALSVGKMDRVLLSIKELNWMDTPRDESGEAT